MEELVKNITHYIAWATEIVAACIVAFGSLIALTAYLRNVFSREKGIIPKDEIRVSLGRTLALALEFLLGADIIKTAVAPTWNDIGQLAAIAVLRTALNYFLERELRGMSKPENKEI